MQVYSSGNPRVHTSSPLESIDAAIEEYERYAENHPDDPLSLDLEEVALDLREEKIIRSLERA